MIIALVNHPFIVGSGIDHVMHHLAKELAERNTVKEIDQICELIKEIQR